LNRSCKFFGHSIEDSAREFKFFEDILDKTFYDLFINEMYIINKQIPEEYSSVDKDNLEEFTSNLLYHSKTIRTLICKFVSMKESIFEESPEKIPKKLNENIEQIKSLINDKKTTTLTLIFDKNQFNQINTTKKSELSEVLLKECYSNQFNQIISIVQNNLNKLIHDAKIKLGTNVDRIEQSLKDKIKASKSLKFFYANKEFCSTLYEMFDFVYNTNVHEEKPTIIFGTNEKNQYYITLFERELKLLMEMQSFGESYDTYKEFEPLLKDINIRLEKLELIQETIIQLNISTNLFQNLYSFVLLEDSQKNPQIKNLYDNYLKQNTFAKFQDSVTKIITNDKDGKQISTEFNDYEINQSKLIKIYQKNVTHLIYTFQLIKQYITKINKMTEMRILSEKDVKESCFNLFGMLSEDIFQLQGLSQTMNEIRFKTTEYSNSIVDLNSISFILNALIFSIYQSVKSDLIKNFISLYNVPQESFYINKVLLERDLEYFITRCSFYFQESDQEDFCSKCRFYVASSIQNKEKIIFIIALIWFLITYHYSKNIKIEKNIQVKSINDFFKKYTIKYSSLF